MGKIFEKRINGEVIRKAARQIVVNRNGMQIINPSEELILSDGWVEYVIPAYEPTEEELLEEAKRHLNDEILDYDSSQEVNEFTIQGIPVWLDKATRAGLMLRFQAEIAMEKTETVLWYNGMQFPLQLNDAMAMLYALEVYASACYDNTQMHLAMIDDLTTIEEVQEYNYRTGYPEKLAF